MLEQVATAFSSLKRVAPVPLLAILVASLILLFSSDNIATTLGIEIFRSTYRQYIGVAIIGSASYLVAHLFWWIKTSFESLLQRTIDDKERHGYLNNLTHTECSYLKPYILGGETVQAFELGDGIAGGLEAKGIIYCASNIGSAQSGFQYQIQPWARDYLRANPHLLEVAIERCSANDDNW